MPAYFHDTPIDVPAGSWVRFDSDQSGTQAVVYNRAGQVIANGVVLSQTGSVPRVTSDAATLYVRLARITGVPISGVVAQTTGVAFTSFDSDADTTNRGGAGGGGGGTVDQTARDSVTSLAASLPGAYASLLPDVATVASPAQLAAGVTSPLTAAGTYTSPALDGAVANPPKRFAVRAPSTGKAILTLPGSTGSTITVALLPGEARSYRQVSTSGWALDQGVPLAQLAPNTTPGLYLPRSGLFDRWKTARNAAFAGGPAVFVDTFGDSTTYGQTGTGDNAGSVNNRPKVQYLRAAAVAAGFPDGGVGCRPFSSVAAMSGTDNLDLVQSQTPAGSFVAGGVGPLNLFGIATAASTGNNGAVIVLQFKGTKARLNVSAPAASGASFTYSLNGGTAVAVPWVTAASTKFKSYPITGGNGSGATNTLTITLTSDGTLNFVPEFYNATGVVFNGWGTPAQKLSSMFDVATANTGWPVASVLGLGDGVYTWTVDPWVAPKSGSRTSSLAILDMGLNEALQATSLADAQTKAGQMQGAINIFAELCRNAAVDALVCVPHFLYTGTPARPYTGIMRAALFEGARGNDLPVADLQAAVGGMLNAATYGGQVHLNALGYQTEAQWLWDNVLGPNAVV